MCGLSGLATKRAYATCICGRSATTGRRSPTSLTRCAPIPTICRWWPRTLLPGYYARLGFTAGAGQGFRKPSLRIPDPAFQAIRLPAYEPWMTGTLVYSEPFWRWDAVGLRESD